MCNVARTSAHDDLIRHPLRVLIFYHLNILFQNPGLTGKVPNGARRRASVYRGSRHPQGYDGRHQQHILELFSGSSRFYSVVRWTVSISSRQRSLRVRHGWVEAWNGRLGILGSSDPSLRSRQRPLRSMSYRNLSPSCPFLYGVTSQMCPGRSSSTSQFQPGSQGRLVASNLSRS